jgi:hypothetical protein
MGTWFDPINVEMPCRETGHRVLNPHGFALGSADRVAS